MVDGRDEWAHTIPTHPFRGLPMSTPQHERDTTKTYSRDQFVAKLRRLADALEQGTAFSIQVDGERLRIPKDAHFSIEHEREGDTQELEFQLIWPARTQENPQDREDHRD